MKKYFLLASFATFILCATAQTNQNFSTNGDNPKSDKGSCKRECCKKADVKTATKSVATVSDKKESGEEMIRLEDLAKKYDPLWNKADSLTMER